MKLCEIINIRGHFGNGFILCLVEVMGVQKTMGVIREGGRG